MIIKCPDCGRKISSDAPICGYCGCSRDRIRRKAKFVGCIVRPIQLLIVCAILIATCKGGFDNNKKHTKNHSDETNVETTVSNDQRETEYSENFASTVECIESEANEESTPTETVDEVKTLEEQSLTFPQTTAESQVSSKDTTPTISLDRLMEITNQQ